MAESNEVSVDSDSFLKEELLHVEELLVSSREECIDVAAKYQNLSAQVEDLIKLQNVSSDDSVTSEHSEHLKEVKSSLEEQLYKYESRIAAYQHNQSNQARIVNDLQNHVEEYRIRCAKLEAALAEHTANEANIVESDSHSQNALSMDLETALIRLEQEKNRCQGLTQINTLLREQLETATEVNQTLTSDVHRLTKEWQHARAQLLAKESEWKEEEQSFSLYFTKESNMLLSLWHQILNFKHDFTNLRNSTERDLSSFKMCMCHSVQSIIELQEINTERSLQPILGLKYNNRESDKFDAPERIENSFETAKLQERIHDLIERNERIPLLLEEKEKANSALCNAVEKINTSLKEKMNKTVSTGKEQQANKLLQEYSGALKEISEILLDDPNCEVSPNIAVLSLIESMSEVKEGILSHESTLQLHSLVSSVKSALQKYRKQIEEANIKVSALKEQNVMQERTVEFLEDERQKMQQLNSQLSSQFESLHLKMQDCFKEDSKTDEVLENKHVSYLESMLKSLNDQIESLNSEKDRLLTVQTELQSKLQNANEEKKNIKISEQNLVLEVNKSNKKIDTLEKKMESIRKEYQQSQELLQQSLLDKELLEEEKTKFSTILSNMEKQCLDLKNCLEKLRDEESFVKDSLITLQNLSQSFSLEKSDLTKSLNDAMQEVEKLRTDKSIAKVELGVEQIQMKSKIEELMEKCAELERERENLQKQLQEVESTKHDVEEEKSQISLRNNDLSNQVTKFSTQKKTFEIELEQIREELKQQVALTENANKENNSLIRTKAELSMKLETMEKEITQLNEITGALQEEKANLEKALYTSQKFSVTLQEEKSDLVREIENHKATITNLQAQLKNLKDFHQTFADDAAKEKEALSIKMQEIEQEFQIRLRNERHQHNVDIDILSQEKESLRGRLVAAIDELFERHQKQQEDLIIFHQEEINNLKKHIASSEREHEEKIMHLEAKNKRIQNDYKLQVSNLERTIKQLQSNFSENEDMSKNFAEQLRAAKLDVERILQEKLDTEQKMQDEINNMKSEHMKFVRDLENQIRDLKQQKDSAVEDLAQLQLKMKNFGFEKNQIIEELEQANSNVKSEISSKIQLEDKVALLENQLQDEKSLNEVINKTFDDCKSRLKSTQAENMELKQKIEEYHQKINGFESSYGKLKSQYQEMKNTLREAEKSRQDLKREVHNLKRKVSSLENTLNSKEQEITELNMLHEKEEEKEQELKQEILSLKQNIMESNASNEATKKELLNSRQKLSTLEHKLKLQQEQQQSVLQEYLSNEQNLSEHRINLERSMVDAAKELQTLRSNLNFEEGKVLALEARVVKLDGAKRDVENRLYSICLFLRSILGLGTDSGFLSVSSNIHQGSWPSHRASPEKSGDITRSSVPDSPHRLNFSKSSSPAQFTVSDLDIELLKSSLMDLIQKFNSIEKERDDVKDVLANVQRQEEELKSEHSRCLSKIFQLKRDLEDKKNVEKELATKIASVHHHEEVIRTLEREKRRLTEKIGNSEFSLSSAEKEKEKLLDQIAEMRKMNEKYQEEIKSLKSAKEAAESKAIKYFKVYQSMEADVELLQETLSNKEREIMALEQSVNKKLQSSESRNKTLQQSVEQLNSIIQKHVENEQLLKQKVNNLSHTLSQTSTSQENLYEDLERFKKEDLMQKSEMSTLRHSNEELKARVDEYKLKIKLLKDEVEDLKQSLAQSEAIQKEYLDQIKKLQTMLLKTQDLEREASQQVSKLEEQKHSLEKRVIELSASLRNNQIIIEEKDDLCQKLEKDRASLQKSLDKIEKEKQRTSEISAKSMIEKSSLGRSLTKMEIENQALQQKVQNLQAELAELEERHAQRVKDFLKSQSLESKLEDDRLRTALKQAEQIMEAREKTHRQRILGLEEQIAVLKGHLEREKLRWQQYHQRSLSTNANINYLHSVLSRSLQNVADDPQKLLPEAERLDLTTEVELSASPGVSISTPSKLSRSASYAQMTSTPKAKKRLDLSSKS
ncbi:rootletin-like [Stegodyphus dumicola]|uniref:rootletin-like n=1 Tax=Stegodyphus dumicola TaxID=202533 RepID=UPI0015A93DBC|nr:rootletin-like [Stegodyphus dumicola]